MKPIEDYIVLSEEYVMDFGLISQKKDFVER